MNARIFLTLAVATAGIAAGCGDPRPAGFVDGKITKELHPEAAKAVRREVDRQFGAPTELVAALQFTDENNLPIDFGRITGEVVAVDRELEDHQFAVQLSSAQDLAPADVEGLGLVFTAGEFQQAVFEAPRNEPRAGVSKGDQLPAYFYAVDYEPIPNATNTGIVSLNFKLSEPPAAGDKLTVVGHRLRNGRRLYRRHCMHCHGYSGDGNGPTARYLNPLPRDYRLGEFKFTSTGQNAAPSRNDLARIIKLGIPGTYMPSFLMEPDDEIADMVEYVRWLALRGEYERYAGLSLLTTEFGRFTKSGWSTIENPEESLQSHLTDFFPDYMEGTEMALIRKWSQAETEEIVVRPKEPRPTYEQNGPEYFESVRRGRALYLSSKTNCYTCHGRSGEGDGPQTTAFWQNKDDPLADGAEYPEPGMHDKWGNKILPRNLKEGQYRGGRRPIDLYRRIKVGIKGTPMPAFGALSDREIWDLVNYVLSVPHQENGTFPVATSKPDDPDGPEKQPGGETAGR